MALLPNLKESEHSTVSKIYAWYEANREPARPHLGASEIGAPCERQLWLKFRWVFDEKLDGRKLRLFETGNLEEPRLLRELRGIGVEVFERDPKTNEQWHFSELGGHFSGACDGQAENIPEAPKTRHILEFKTHNVKNFDKLKSSGVKSSKPQHYDQVQCYMGGFGLERTLYLAVCKDTDEVYAERINFDVDRWLKLKAKAERIIFAPKPPEKIHSNSLKAPCQFITKEGENKGKCAFLELCFKPDSKIRKPLINCRTCVHSSPSGSGGWFCEFWRIKPTTEQQRDGCTSHLFIPELLPVLEIIGANNGCVVYRDITGKKIYNHEGGELCEEPFPMPL